MLQVEEALGHEYLATIHDIRSVLLPVLSAHIKSRSLKGGSLMCVLQVEEALGHEYLATLHDISDEPVCPDPFTFDLESDDLTPDVVGLSSSC